MTTIAKFTEPGIKLSVSHSFTDGFHISIQSKKVRAASTTYSRANAVEETARLCREYRYGIVSPFYLHSVDFEFAAQLYPLTTKKPKCFKDAIHGGIFVKTNNNGKIVGWL